MATPLISTTKGWDAAADSYDEFGIAITEKFSRIALESTLKCVEGLKILDVATGTGSLSILAAEMLKPVNGIVLATDFSEKMIKVLDRKINEQGLKNITAKVMDGQALEVEDNSIDFVYSIFGLMFFPDRLKGFKEMFRVLKTNGKAVVLTWTTQNPMVNLMSAILKKLNIISPSHAPPLSNPDKFKTEMSDAGFSEVDVQTVKQKISINYAAVLPSLRYNPGLEGMVKLTGKPIDELIEVATEVANEMFPGLVEFECAALMGVGKKINNK